MLPDLGAWEQAGGLIFVPINGGNVTSWSHRLAGLGLPEFHLYDREVEPETANRERAIELVNQRPDCRAVLTNKRHLENYLHPAAILEARGIELVFGDEDDVPDLAARTCFTARWTGVTWEAITGRMRKRLRDRAKRWLNTWAAERMTAARLAERDPGGEVRGWLETIGQLAHHTTDKDTS